MIVVKQAHEIERMREAGQILGQLFQHIENLIQPGITTEGLDQEAELFIRSRGAEPAFKGYRGFPGTICASVNEVVVHGIPGLQRLREGDIIGIDVGTLRDGYYSDSCRTFAVGTISKEARALMRATEASLAAGIRQAVPGNRLHDISAAIQAVVESAGFGVIRDFVGHGIGKALHEDPQIPNFGARGTGPLLKEGMTFALEPMVSQGSWRVRILEDGWTAVTSDGKLSAHFEHTIAITGNGPRILTAA